MNPIPASRAYLEDSPDANLSQAVMLVSLGRFVGARWLAPKRGAEAAQEEFIDGFPAEDFATLGIPRVEAAARRLGGGEDLAIRGRLAERVPEGLRADARRRFDETRRAAERFLAKPEPGGALELMAACLVHPSPHTRVAAAWAYGVCLADPAIAVRVLADVLSPEGKDGRPDALAEQMAATALAQFDPKHPALARLLVPGERRGGRPSSTSLVVHGTFARTSSWWQPGGDFHGYLKSNVAPDLYDAPDRFEWTGEYNDDARGEAADGLAAWHAAHGHVEPDIYAHSHGANVVMLATNAPRSLRVGKLVLLSCPVHKDKYMPDFANVAGKVFSIRVHADPVIFIDGGRQRFRDPSITEHTLDVWFDHSATHDPAVWQSENVPAKIV
ncbi:MAG: hypothetical protein N2544_16215 [Burkholderiales bacterium]|nr:hypothetical protein [Burkholderiales bacterium]